MHLKYGTMTAIACLRHALERQDLSCTYLAHHELQSVLIIITIIRHKQGVQTFSCHQWLDLMRQPSLNTTQGKQIKQMGQG